MTIDMHSHWRPPELADALRARTDMPRIERDADGDEVLIGPRGPQKLAKAFDSIDERLASMDRHGIDVALISMLGGFGWMERLAVEQSLPLVKIYNDSVSAMCASHPDRFAAVAALPLADLDAAAQELDRAMGLPGMVGAQIPGDGFVTLERAQAFAPVFEVANRHKALLCIHRATMPGMPAPRPDKDDDNFMFRDGTLNMQASISSFMLTFCLTDFLDDYPDVAVQTHNLGGNLPFEFERLDHRSLIAFPDAELPSDRIRRSRVVVDCNSLGARSIELGVDLYGAERIVFGTDGSDFGSEWSLKAVADARIDESQRQAILHGNAAALLSRRSGIQAAAE
jgi:predicted TIM-barrel fold metal-dependent hydrolase